MEGFSRRAKPLFDLLKKGERFVWGAEQQRAFDDLKICLTTAPILALPIDGGRFVIDTDASDSAAGAVLSQIQNGEEKVIAYVSRTFRGAETRYTTNQRELSAVIFGLKQFRSYVLGRTFLLRTDHSALRYVMTTKEVGTIQGRHLDFLAQFKGMTIEHRPGVSHRNGDALSRRPSGCTEAKPGRPYTAAAAATRPTESDERVGAGKRPKGTTTTVSDEQPDVMIDETAALCVSAVTEMNQPEVVKKQRRMGRTKRLRALKSECEFEFVCSLNDALKKTLWNDPSQQQKNEPEVVAVVQTRSQTGSGKSQIDGHDAVSSNQATKPICETDDKAETERLPVDFLLFSAEEAMELLSKTDLTIEQREDPVLNEIIQLKSYAGTDDANQLKGDSATHEAYRKQWKRLQMEGNLLMLQADGSEELLTVLPTKLGRAYVIICHLESGHQGQTKTAERFATRFYFPGWRNEAKMVCTECPTCAGYCKGAPPRQGEMQLMEVKLPMDRLSIDLVGPNPATPRHNVYILTIIDYFSRYLWAIPIRNKSARSVITALHRHIFSTWGLCRELYSDQGGEFSNSLMDDVCKEYGIRKVRTSPYRAASNGRCERAHRTIHSILAKTVKEDQTNWDLILAAATLSYNTNRHTSTGCTPISLMTGREAIMPVDLGMSRPSRLTTMAGPVGYKDWLQLKLRQTFETARQRSARMAKLRKLRYDRKVKAVTFSVGTKVLLRREASRPGLNSKWRRLYDGPYVVEERRGPVNYWVRRLPNGRRTVAHVDRMRLWRRSATKTKKKRTATDSADEMELNEPLRRSGRLQKRN